MGEETLKPRTSLAAPIIFFLVVLFQFLSKYLENMKKRGSKSPMEIQLRAEIKQLLKEANSLSEPSTFAQAAKLRRTAAAKEKEMENYKGLNGKENNLSFDSYLKVLTAVKVFTYLVLVCWFWGVPVTIISKQLVQPFGTVLSWKAGGPFNDKVMVGIVPWLVLSTRVGKYICRKVLK
ncbi:protein GET1 isoform X3 [Malania oleifera]|uniref:protein GET1 isoform X3 n=1 Tax=Malania oleifera TaxID=397392 RepID=UPI0025AE7FDB|nr:protein GET1 isoform X3 [Malania oleifera]